MQGDERVVAAYLGEPFEDAPGQDEVAEVEAAEANAEPTKDAAPGKENDR